MIYTYYQYVYIAKQANSRLGGCVAHAGKLLSGLGCAYTIPADRIPRSQEFGYKRRVERVDLSGVDCLNKTKPSGWPARLSFIEIEPRYMKLYGWLGSCCAARRAPEFGVAATNGVYAGILCTRMCTGDSGIGTKTTLFYMVYRREVSPSKIDAWAESVRLGWREGVEMELWSCCIVR